MDFQSYRDCISQIPGKSKIQFSNLQISLQTGSSEK